MNRILVLLLSLFSSLAAAEVTLLTSIRPLALVAQQLVTPEDRVELLINSAASPHHYQLKPSERLQLNEADLVVWVGPEIETFLQKPLKQRQQADVLTLSELPGLQWPQSPPSRKDPHGHNHSKDPHIWLNPENLVLVVKALAAELTARAPQHEASYKANSLKLLDSLALVDKQLQQQLAPVAEVPFLVMHPAYDHFVQRYGLNQREFLVETPESSMSAKHRYYLQQLGDIACVFSDEGQNTKMVETIARQLDARVGSLDPLGITVPTGKGITGFLENIAADLIACLATKA